MLVCVCGSSLQYSACSGNRSSELCLCVCVVHLCSAQLALEIGHHSYACVCVWFISAVLSLLWKSVIIVMLVCVCGSSLQYSACSGNRSSELCFVCVCGSPLQCSVCSGNQSSELCLCVCVVHLCSFQLALEISHQSYACVCVWFISAVFSLLWKSDIRVMLVCVCGSSLQYSACSGNRSSELCLCVCVVHLCSAQLALEIGHQSYALCVCVVHLCSAQLALEISHQSYACVCVWFISAVLSLLWKSVIRVMLVCVCGSSLQCSACSGNRTSELCLCVCVVHLCNAQLALEIGHHSYACVCVCGSSLQCSACS